MARNAYCQKCGVRAITKCPSFRHVFTQGNDPYTEMLEMFVKVRKTGEREHTDGTMQYEVAFATFATNDQDALTRIFERIEAAIKNGANTTVAACIHEFVMMPGQTCDLGCHSTKAEIEIPDDPFA